MISIIPIFLSYINIDAISPTIITKTIIFESPAIAKIPRTDRTHKTNKTDPTA